MAAFGRLPISHGDTFAPPESLTFVAAARKEAVRIVRCLGPSNDLPALAVTRSHHRVKRPRKGLDGFPSSARQLFVS